jgi:hypothetical protein
VHQGGTRCSVGHHWTHSLPGRVCVAAEMRPERIKLVTALAHSLGLGGFGWWVPCMVPDPSSMARPVTTIDRWPDSRPVTSGGESYSEA